MKFGKTLPLFASRMPNAESHEFRHISYFQTTIQGLHIVWEDECHSDHRIANECVWRWVSYDHFHNVGHLVFDITCSWKYVGIIAIVVFVLTHLVMYLMKKYVKSVYSHLIAVKHRVWFIEQTLKNDWRTELVCGWMMYRVCPEINRSSILFPYYVYSIQVVQHMSFS